MVAHDLFKVNISRSLVIKKLISAPGFCYTQVDWKIGLDHRQSFGIGSITTAPVLRIRACCDRPIPKLWRGSKSIFQLTWV
jgi:hypothetical protein